MQKGTWISVGFEKPDSCIALSSSWLRPRSAKPEASTAFPASARSLTAAYAAETLSCVCNGLINRVFLKDCLQSPRDPKHDAKLGCNKRIGRLGGQCKLFYTRRKS